MMNTQMILNYLSSLSANNNREWYHAHKAEHQAANAQFEELIQTLIFQIGEFDASILGHAPKELTFKMVRDYLSAHGAEWETIITAPSFQEHFTVGGTALKNVPAGYEKEHLQAKYLKFKSWYLEYPFQDEVFADSRQFLSTATDIFRRMKPFNDYLNKALAGFQMPAR